MKRKLKILYVVAEISPYANVGGLGEVGKSYPEKLADTTNVEVRRVMPLYKNMGVKMRYQKDFPVPMERGYETCVLKSNQNSNELTTYFIQNDKYFYRDNIYGYEDDGFRFFFFCRAVIEMLRVISYKPDIIHTNDWHTGLIPLLIKQEFPEIKTVYTIHNITYQGYIPASYLQGLHEQELCQLGWPEWINFMKAGIVYADRVTTVSAGYREEILQPSNSQGMSSLIEQRQCGITGILNGIDVANYDPARKDALVYPYNEDNIEEKKKNRSLLRSEYGLPDRDIPLISMITRLDYSKGIDLLFKALHQLKLDSFQMIILGSGNPYYQGMLSSIADVYSDNIVVDFNYSLELAQKIYAASDIYLMPSRLEPCGLGQLYAMRYGAVPVVHPVGGLKCTVVDDKEQTGNSSGFFMEQWSGEALASAIERAIKAYHTPAWKDYVKNGMRFDSSWKQSVSEYKKLYNEIINDSQ